MNRQLSGIVAGFIATIVLSIFMLLKASTGFGPPLNVPMLLGTMSGAGMAGGWIIHFIIGTIIWGLIFAYLYDSIPGGSPLVRGLLFSVGAWLIMMIILMPIAGKGLFAHNVGIAIATLVLHLIYGAVLGFTYGKLAPAVPGQEHAHA